MSEKAIGPFHETRETPIESKPCLCGIRSGGICLGQKALREGYTCDVYALVQTCAEQADTIATLTADLAHARTQRDDALSELSDVRRYWQAAKGSAEAAASALRSAQQEIDSARMLCNGSCDIELARRQVGPDGDVPGNARECAQLWEREAARLQRCKTSIARMLGWQNDPPQETLERDINALKARVQSAQQDALRAAAENIETTAKAKGVIGDIPVIAKWLRARADALEGP